MSHPKHKPENHLYYGDNLTIMQHMPKHCVDLIYLDPPFNSKKNYNLMYKTLTGLPVPEQVDAFCDTWEMDTEKEELAKKMPVLMREHGVEDYYVEFWRLWINALRHTQPHLLAYLIYMVQRLLHMKSILRPTGSIYLHCDSTASHYIKVMMDGIFGHKNFRNEIIWKRANAHNDPKGYGRITDSLLFYTMGNKYKWNTQHTPYREEYYDSHFKKDEEGRWYRTVPLDAPRHGEGSPNLLYDWKGKLPAPSRTWAIKRETMEQYERDGLLRYTRTGTPTLLQYADEMRGVPLQNIWTDIPPVNPQAKERLGYPTQKPVALLKRIITASSDKGDVVFDPFCGCGTTIYAAQETERKWIGCDIAILSIKLIREVLTGDKYRLVEGVHFDVNGIPASVEAAQELFKRDPFQFQHWLVERIGGFPMLKKVADKGIDGRMYFETQEGLKAMVLSVKGGKVRPTDLRDLRGVLERETDTELAGFLCLNEPTKAMREEAVAAGQFEYSGVKYDRMQILTVRDILEKKREFHTPTKVGTRIATGQQSLPLQ
ncbi:MAG TPA: DNA methyltransferase [Pseudolabrys sp.]|nr:DNA methyltransferase [Pseudolabrys sp.]